MNISIIIIIMIDIRYWTVIFSSIRINIYEKTTINHATGSMELQSNPVAITRNKSNVSK